jgi:Lar family restriction alleviation protein
MSKNWKPCPFCGGTDIRHTEHSGMGRREYVGYTVYSMCCYNCGATFPNRYRLELLKEAWNRRVKRKTSKETSP